MRADGREVSASSELGTPEEACPVVADVEGVRLVLHARRLRGQMTLVEAARRAGLNRDGLSRLEKGQTTQVRFSTLAKLLSAYECTLTDLVEVERAPATVPLYTGALAALAAGELSDHWPSRRAVRRSPELDVMTDGEESTFAAVSDALPPRSVHRGGAALRSGPSIGEAPRRAGLLLATR